MPKATLTPSTPPRRPGRLTRLTKRLTGGTVWDFLYAVIVSIWLGT